MFSFSCLHSLFILAFFRQSLLHHIEYLYEYICSIKHTMQTKKSKLINVLFNRTLQYTQYNIIIKFILFEEKKTGANLKIY